MRLYHNRRFWRLVLEVTGSVVWRSSTLVSGLVLAGISAVIQWMIDEDIQYRPDLPHHYGMHALGVVVAFAIVFRTNLGWQRYWEAVTQLHFMYSKWADAYSQFYAFASVTVMQTRSKGGDGAEGKIQRVVDELSRVENLFCLLSAIASDSLINGDTAHMERRCADRRSRWRDQIVERAELRSTRGIAPLPIFVGGHRNSCKRGANGNLSSEYAVRVVPGEGDLQRLAESPDRANTVMHWILFALAKISKDLDTAPPIQSRMYQELSNGMLGFSNALKIADVPFPFPYAQLLTIVLFMYSVFIPLYITIFTKSMIVGPIMTFLLFQGVWCVNEVAKELENPFGTDSNDIQVPDFHERFIQALTDVRTSNEVDMSGPNLPSPKPAPVKEIIAAEPTSAVKEPDAVTPTVDDQRLPPVAESHVGSKQPPSKQGHQVEHAAGEQGFSKSAWSARVGTGTVVSGGSAILGGEIINTSGTEVVDIRLQNISARMEQHLAKIRHDIESIGLATSVAVQTFKENSRPMPQDIKEQILTEEAVRSARCSCEPLPQFRSVAVDLA